MKAYLRKYRGDTGFSLMELIVTVAIIGVMATVAIPGFSSWLPNYKLKKAAQDIYSNMQLTRMAAIRSNASLSINFDPTNGKFQKPDGSWIILDEEYGNGVAYGGGNATKNATVGGGALPPDGVSYLGNTSTFNSRGMGSAGYVYVQNSKGTAYTIGTFGTGVIVLRKWDESAGDWN